MVEVRSVNNYVKNTQHTLNTQDDRAGLRGYVQCNTTVNTYTQKTRIICGWRGFPSIFEKLERERVQQSS